MNRVDRIFFYGSVWIGFTHWWTLVPGFWHWQGVIACVGSAFCGFHLGQQIREWQEGS
jgi:hypothetical protein